MKQIRLGDVTIDAIYEDSGAFISPFEMMPAATPEDIARHMPWLAPTFYDPVAEKLILMFQSFILRTPHHTILIDSCIGEDKQRANPHFHMRKWPWLANLKALGLTPEDIDIVMCTHLHPDHVGWNTQLRDGRWVPTFPNARYVFAETEFGFWSELNKKGAKYSDGCIDDSVLPVVEAGQADIVADDYAFSDEIWFEQTPGHTPGHVSIGLKSAGTNAIVSGDVVHTPVQCREPGWSAVGCSDRVQSADTRRSFLDRYCETDTLVMTGHFPSPSVGHVCRHGDSFDFKFSGT